MGLSCRIIRGENNSIDFVEAPNGEESVLFNNVLNYLKNNNDYEKQGTKTEINIENEFKEKALDLWTVPYTIGFKNINGDWDNNKKLDIPILELIKGRDSILLDNYNGMFSKFTTGVTFYDDILEDNIGGNIGYHYYYKKQKARIEMMSPDDYLKKVRLGFGTLTDENIVNSSKENINKGINKGDKIDMPYLSYLNGNFAQEGRNRATVAKERGEPLIPVLVVTDVSNRDLKAISEDMIEQLLDNYSFTSYNHLLEALKNEFNLHRDAIRYIENNILEEGDFYINNRHELYGSKLTNLKLDKNGEPSLSDVLHYVRMIRNQNSKLTNKELAELSNNFYSLPVNSLDELYKELRNTFYKNGYFEISKKGLEDSILYTELEKSEILTNHNIQNSIKDLVEKIEVEYLSDNSQFDELVGTYYFNEQDLLEDANEIIGIGKFKKLNPTEVSNTISNIVGGIKDIEEFDAKVQTIPYASIVKMYNTDNNFRNEFFDRYSNLKKIHSFKDVGGILERRPVHDTFQILKETLIANKGDNTLGDDVSFLNQVNDDIWNTSEKEVKGILKGVESKLLAYNIDVIGLQDSYNEKTKDEVIEFIDSLNNFVNDLDNATLNDNNLLDISNIVNNYFDISTENKAVFDEVRLSNENKTLFELVPSISDVELFKNHSLLRTSEGYFQKVNVIEDLDSFYNYVYNLVLQDNTLLDKEAYYPTAFDVNNEFNKGKLNNLENREAIINDIKRYALNKMFYLEDSVEGIDTNLLEKYVLYKIINKHPLETTDEISYENEYSRFVNFKGNFDYLSTDFISDFYNYKLQNKFKNSELYKDVLQYFDVNEKGIVLNNKDLNLAKQINLLSPNNKVMNDLRQYSIIAKDYSLRNVFTFPIESIEVNNIPFERAFYTNNPKFVPFHKGMYETKDDLLLTYNTQYPFLRTKDGLYEKIQEEGNVIFYRKISILENPYLNNYSQKLNVDTKVDFKEYSNYITTNTDNVVEVNKLYTKGEEEIINNRIDECG